ncbi:MAG: hypothetical protein ACLQMF_19415 [Rectinemataceae bacterium]
MPMVVAARRFAAHTIHSSRLAERRPGGAPHDCPSEVDQHQLDELHLQIVRKAGD